MTNEQQSLPVPDTEAWPLGVQPPPDDPLLLDPLVPLPRLPDPLPVLLAALQLPLESTVSEQQSLPSTYNEG